MPIIFFHSEPLLFMTAVGHMLLNCRAMIAHTLQVVVLQVKTDPSPLVLFRCSRHSLKQS